jgi:uncharacterized coiled-coil DUF342 family protein
MERLAENYKSTADQLLKADINLKNELYMFETLFGMRDRIYVKRKADKLHREIVRIKEVDLARYNKQMEDLDIRIDVAREKSHTDLEAAKGLWTERDSIRAEAQNYHKQYLDKNREIKDIKKGIDRKKREKHDLFMQIDSWSSELKKSPEERRQMDNLRKLKDAVAKYKRGESLSLEEMGMLLESGELK